MTIILGPQGQRAPRAGKVTWRDKDSVFLSVVCIIHAKVQYSLGWLARSLSYLTLLTSSPPSLCQRMRPSSNTSKLSRVAWSVAICACDRPLSKMPQPSSLESLGHCATDCILGIVSNQHGTRLKNAERQVPTLQDRLTGSLKTMKGSLRSE